MSQPFPTDIVTLDSQGIYQFPYFHSFQNMGIKSFPHIVVIHPRWSWPKTGLKLHRPVKVLTHTSAWSPYGGRISMPALDGLAADGLTYTQWHTVALCSPTRSCINTGRNHNLNGMGVITEGANGFPG